MLHSLSRATSGRWGAEGSTAAFEEGPVQSAESASLLDVVDGVAPRAGDADTTKAGILKSNRGVLGNRVLEGGIREYKWNIDLRI